METERTFFEHLWALAPGYGKGALIALAVALCAEILGTVGGLLLALARLYGGRLFGWPALVYIDIIRGTPMLVQILFAAYGIPALISGITGEPFRFNPIIAGTLALGLNSAAYVSEVYRTAISSIDKGQAEAARALGLGRVQTMRFVILPQAIRWAIPPLGNEFVTLLKDTSLLSVIGIVEVTGWGQYYFSNTYATVPTYLGMAATYLLMTMTFSFSLRKVESRLRIP